MKFRDEGAQEPDGKKSCIDRVVDAYCGSWYATLSYISLTVAKKGGRGG